VITPFDVFATKDMPIAIGCANDHLFETLADAVDRPAWKSDPRFQGMFARFANHVALKREMEAVLAVRSAGEWLTRLSDAGVPCSALHDMKDVASDPQLAARAMVVEVDDPEMGKLRMAGSPFKISGYPDRPTRPPAPNLDEARADVLAELSRPDEPQRARKRGAARHPLW
jgi:CoA:oxalate CoA-transferase